MHRPKNWEKFNTDEEINECDQEQARNRMLVENQVYEAGADDLITTLKDEGVFTYGNHTPDIDNAPEVSGYWCFLPDEGHSYTIPKEKHPTVEEFVGSDPDYTGKMTTAEYILGMRDNVHRGITMDVLLNAEDILKVMVESRATDIKGGQEFTFDLLRAQLKRVFEWGEEDCPHAGTIANEPFLHKHDCYTCWQSLKPLEE